MWSTVARLCQWAWLKELDEGWVSQFAEASWPTVGSEFVVTRMTTNHQMVSPLLAFLNPGVITGAYGEYDFPFPQWMAASNSQVLLSRIFPDAYSSKSILNRQPMSDTVSQSNKVLRMRFGSFIHRIAPLHN